MGGLQNVKHKTEFLIVGAGAAGCSLGYLLKKAGAEVLVLERQDEATRVKLCAGILENRAEQAFASVFGMSVDEAGLAPMNLEYFNLRCGTHELPRPRKGAALPAGNRWRSRSQMVWAAVRTVILKRAASCWQK